MIGVVLWSDAALSKAVIWCEDQGDLAFFKQQPENPQVELSSGDWVEFNLVLRGNFRQAENPVVLAEPASRGIAEHLTSAAASLEASEPAAAAEPSGTGAVIPFPGFASRPAADACPRVSQGRL